MLSQLFKPELLLPSGTIESFFAAMEGGADAVYLGLKKFNARNRARNFSYADLQNVVAEAHSRGRKVYVTVNTLIKNVELAELIETLSALSQCHPDALIVQDLAVANIVGRFFPELQLHASTQMSVHNSVQCNYMKYCGFSRVVQEKDDSAELRYAKFKEKQFQKRYNQIEKMEEQLDDLEHELSILVLSAEMHK